MKLPDIIFNSSLQAAFLFCLLLPVLPFASCSALYFLFCSLLGLVLHFVLTKSILPFKELKA